MARSVGESEARIQGRYAICVGEPVQAAPRGWQWVRLLDIATLESGHTPSRSVSAYWNGSVPWVTIPDARLAHGGVVETTRQKITQAGLDNSSARLLPAGTVCLSRTASVGYVTRLGVDAATSQDFVCWICSPAIDPRFLQWLLLAEGDDIRRFGKGTTHTTIYFPEVRAFRVCVPPLAEQRRIVAKLEALLGRIRRAREALDAVPAMVERYKKSVLGAAFRSSAGAAMTPPVRLERHPPPKSCWPETFLRDVARLESGHTPRKSIAAYWDGGVPWISLRDIRAADGSRISETERTISDAGLKNSSARLLPAGTVVLSRDISVGFVTVMSVPMATSQHFANWVCGPLLMPEFLMHSLRASRERLLAASEGTTVTTIFYPALRDLRVLLPPLDEQRAIVARIDAAFARARALLSAADAARAQLDVLERSVLAKAFRGELVEQDPADEPASVMLDRVRAERAKSVVPAKKPRKPRASA